MENPTNCSAISREYPCHKTKVHYRIAQTKEAAFDENVSFTISPCLLTLDNIVCLINSGYEHTEFERIPEEIERWMEQFGMDSPHFPNIGRLWGSDKSVFVYSLHYEIPNVNSNKSCIEAAFIMSYQEQLDAIIEAASKIAEVIPYACVRVNVEAACWKCHDLEINFFYPCDAEYINNARLILETQFDYVWFIGMETDPRRDEKMITLISRNVKQDELLMKACVILKNNGVLANFVKYEDSRASTWWSKDDMADTGSPDLPDDVRMEILERKASVIKEAMVKAGNETIAEILDDEIGIERWDD